MQSMTVSKKLTLCFSTLLVLVIAVSAILLSALSSMETRSNLTANVEVKKLALAGQFSAAVANIRSAWRGVILFSITKDAERLRGAEQALDAGVADGNKALAELRPLVESDDGMVLVDGAKKELDNVDSTSKTFEKLCAAGDFDGANKFTNTYVGASFGKLGETAPALVAQVQKLIEIRRQETAAQNTSSRWIAICAIAFALALGAAILFVIRQINETLRQLTQDLREGAEQVATAASQVASTSQGLAQGASEQAASLEETSSSTVEINSMTQRNAENSREAAKVVDKSGLEFEGANRMLAEMVDSMNQINASSGKISKIIKIIDEIAFQTNILALNAAVEAARAGDAGMGFAVVADEVRNLAQRCAQAAKDTTDLIEESTASSRSGSEKLRDVEAAIRSISSQAGSVKTLVDEVSAGSQEQSRGLQQISASISQMEHVTQSTAASAEQSAAASQELSAQSRALNDIVVRLSKFVGASHSEQMRKSVDDWKPVKPQHREHSWNIVPETPRYLPEAEELFR
jgi:methyl-accepting chemotaxis protein/methyl-accepting chemotaxis protein-1 (serine sensor receptor)